MIESLSTLNKSIIADKDAAFEIVNDFTLSSGSDSINRILEKVLCAKFGEEIIEELSINVINYDYREVLNDVFLKIYRGESFEADDYV